MNKIKQVLIGFTILAFITAASFIGTLMWIKADAYKDNPTEKKVEKEIETSIHKVESPIIANIKGASNKSMQVSIELKLRNETKEDKKFIEGLTDNEGEIITVVLAFLRDKTYEEATKPDAPMTMRKEIANKLNEFFGVDNFIAANFRDYKTN